jgi:hypothetical protein
MYAYRITHHANTLEQLSTNNPGGVLKRILTLCSLHGGVKVHFHIFLTSALDGRVIVSFTPGLLPPQIKIDMRLHGAWRRAGCNAKTKIIPVTPKTIVKLHP